MKKTNGERQEQHSDIQQEPLKTPLGILRTVKILDDLMDELMEDMLNMSDEEILLEAKEEGINVQEAVREVKDVFRKASQSVSREHTKNRQ